MQSRSVFNNSILSLAFALLAGAGPGALTVFAQTDLPPEVRSLPLWPGETEAIRQFPDTFVFRETTGQIVVSYPDSANTAHRIMTRFWLRNRVEPHVLAAVTRMPDGTYSYRYTVQNGAGAKAAIWSWSIVGPPSKESSASHAIWKGFNSYHSVTAPQALLPGTKPGSYIGWMDGLDQAPIAPGRQQSGFEITSPLRPGLATAYTAGKEDPIVVTEDVPESVAREITLLERPEIMNKAFVTIGPRFAADATRSDIVRTFESDVGNLQKLGLLAPNSVFLQQLQQALGKAETANDGAAISVDSTPSTELERELQSAVQLALGVGN